jgi:hypothetical protein
MMRSLEAGFAPADAEGAKAAMEKAMAWWAHQQLH